MIVGALQLDIVKNNKEANLNKVSELIGSSTLDLAVLPELFSTGYVFETKDEILAAAEEIPYGITTDKLIAIASRKNCHIVGTIIEKENDNLFITAVVAGPDKYVGKQRKRHLTKGEVPFYLPGEETVLFEINGCRVGVVICFEGWFPESVRELTLRGAQIICHSALIMSEKTLDIMRVRAIENRSFLIVANSISSEPYKNEIISFRGDSRVIHYDGTILAEAHQEEKLILVAINPAEAAKKELDDCEDIVSEIKKHKYLWR